MKERKPQNNDMTGESTRSINKECDNMKNNEAKRERDKAKHNKKE